MTTVAHEPLSVFCSYSHRDEEYLNVLRGWLRGLERQGLIEWWHDREISPGWEWEEAIDKNLRTAEIILLLVTPDLMASDYVFEKEIDKAVERHERGEARLIPIIVRPALWKGTPLGKLQALPKDAIPISRWPDRDEAWLDVTEGIQKAVEELLVKRRERAAKERYREAVEEIWADNKVSDTEVQRLDALTSELRLSADVAADIEREIMSDTRGAILGRQEQAAREEDQRKRLDELYAQAQQSHQDQEWQAVINVFKRIHAEEAAYSDPEGLLESAREALETQERERRIAALYNEGQRHMKFKEWQQAVRSFEKVLRLEPAYWDTERLLSRARQQVRRSRILDERSSNQKTEPGQTTPEEANLLAATNLGNSDKEALNLTNQRVKGLNVDRFPTKEQLRTAEGLRELEEKYAGYTVYDNRGEKIGKVDDLFIDDSGREEYIGVKIGFWSTKSTLIPMGIVSVNEAAKAIEVSQSKDRVRDAPKFSDDTDLTPEYEERLRSHFGLQGRDASSTRGYYGG